MLLEHSTLKLNARLVAQHDQAWTEDTIRARTAALSLRIVALWPRPAGVVPASAPEPVPVTPPAIAKTSGAASLYALLIAWLRGVDRDDIRLTFEQVGRLLGEELPLAARTSAGPWSADADDPLSRALAEAGWQAAAVDVTAERVELRRV